MNTRDKLIAKIKIKGAGFSLMPADIADLILEDRKRIISPLLKCLAPGNYNSLNSYHEAMEESIKLSGLDAK